MSTIGSRVCPASSLNNNHAPRKSRKRKSDPRGAPKKSPHLLMQQHKSLFDAWVPFIDWTLLVRGHDNNNNNQEQQQPKATTTTTILQDLLRRSIVHIFVVVIIRSSNREETKNTRRQQQQDVEGVRGKGVIFSRFIHGWIQIHTLFLSFRSLSTVNCHTHKVIPTFHTDTQTNTYTHRQQNNNSPSLHNTT